MKELQGQTVTGKRKSKNESSFLFIEQPNKSSGNLKKLEFPPKKNSLKQSEDVKSSLSSNERRQNSDIINETNSKVKSNNKV